MAEVPADATDVGFAKTVTVDIAIGLSNRVTMLKAPLLADAVIFTDVSTELRPAGTTVTRTDPCPKELVVAVLPLGNVTVALSDPKVTVAPTANKPELSYTVAVTFR
jgi:hypothetical protein